MIIQYLHNKGNTDLEKYIIYGLNTKAFQIKKVVIIFNTKKF